VEEAVLRRLVNRNQLEPYIRHIRFPQYKNIAPFTRIDFTFPITALVGANGTNKSSLLRALYGAPGNNNLGNFWFSTETDPIVEGDNFPNCFVYGYRNEHRQETVEVIKTRVRKEADPDYWEPSRPIIRYDMAAMPDRDAADPNRLQTRWKTISKDVEFIDFRHALSAFDRYFYYGDLAREKSFAEKKSFIRGRAPHLKNAIDTECEHYNYYVERIVGGQNGPLSDAEVNEVRTILGRSYEEIRLIGHRFFRLEGYTARIVDSNLRYTEAFAGSGEFATIMLVTRIMRAKEKSLILLDEPEVSLHPGAQGRLLDFLGEQVIKHKHQVIFTTHSPALIRGLPSDAVKVLAVESKSSRVILAAQHAMPEEAFLSIGEPIAGLKTVLTEDRLAIEIVKRALRVHAPQLLSLLTFKFFPGGASVLFNHYLPPYSSEGRRDVLCLLDGDQRPRQAWPCDRDLQLQQDENLAELVKSLSGSDVKFPIDSGNSTNKAVQTASARRSFLSWCFRHVRYLPGESSPEEFVLAKTHLSDGTDAKVRFAQLTRRSLGLVDGEKGPDGDDIFAEQRRRVADIADDDADLQRLAGIIIEFVSQGQN
jgi:ABC-type transport system involved in cytochrome c biogenesis ATPase subunit